MHSVAQEAEAKAHFWVAKSDRTAYTTMAENATGVRCLPYGCYTESKIVANTKANRGALKDGVGTF